MKMILPVCPLPDEMGWVLKSRFYKNKKNYSKIADEINKSAVLAILIPQLFKDYMKNGSTESVLNAIGWNGFRDRLSAMYIYKMQYGTFPTQIDLDQVRQLELFEDEFINFIPEGNSRIFMLGFYFKLCDIESQSSQSSQLSTSLLDTSDLIKELVQNRGKKSLKLDWIIVTLKILENIMSEDEIFHYIQKSKGNLSSLFKSLNEEQKTILITNLLAYGTSINEEEIFIDDRV